MDAYNNKSNLVGTRRDPIQRN